MDFESAIRAYMGTQPHVLLVNIEINAENRPIITVNGIPFIAVGNSMVPAPTTQRAAPLGFDAHKGMGER